MAKNLWELIKDKDISQLVFVYEMVLAEMRKHAWDDTVIDEWVRRIDSERDAFVQSQSDRCVECGNAIKSLVMGCPCGANNPPTADARAESGDAPR